MLFKNFSYKSFRCLLTVLILWNLIVWSIAFYEPRSSFSYVVAPTDTHFAERISIPVITSDLNYQGSQRGRSERKAIQHDKRAKPDGSISKRSTSSKNHGGKMRKKSISGKKKKDPEQRPTLVLVDGFTPYLLSICRDYCAQRGIQLVEVVSPYLSAVLEQQHQSQLPDALKAPEAGDELQWAIDRGLQIESKSKLDATKLHIISMSESGVGVAERLQTALKSQSKYCLGDSCRQLRFKHLANERAKAAGLPVVKQLLTADWREAESYLLDELLMSKQTKERQVCCVLKPTRGVASDGVFLCSNIAEAESAFRRLLGAPQFAGGRNEAVLLQECAQGNEYAVDTIAMGGEIKVIAVWRYSKFAINGAPFVYQCTELVDCSSDMEAQVVCDYCVAILEAQQMQYGPTHTEIKICPATEEHSGEGIGAATENDRFARWRPRLMEINARWHAQNFLEIMRECLPHQTDSVTATLHAYFDPTSFRQLPPRPPPLKAAGMIVHLVNCKEGIVQRVVSECVNEMEQLPSVRYLEVNVAAGDALVKTTDIRTDSGYVVLINDCKETLQSDFKRICTLQYDMFEMNEPEPVVPEDDAALTAASIKTHRRRKGSRRRSIVQQKQKEQFFDRTQPGIFPSTNHPYHRQSSQKNVLNNASVGATSKSFGFNKVLRFFRSFGSIAAAGYGVGVVAALSSPLFVNTFQIS